MFLSLITFLGRDLLWPVVGVMVVSTWLLWRSFRTAPLSRSHRLIAFLLKWVGLVLIALGLLDPHLIRKRAKSGANLVAVVVDTSASMRIKDVDASTNRAGIVRELLDPDQSRWLGAIEKDFQVRLYGVDDQLVEVADMKEAQFEGTRSGLLGGLKDLGERFRGRPLAGVVLLSDGNATDASIGVRASMPGVPVFPVLIGSDAVPKDIAVSKVTSRISEFEDAPITIEAQVESAGYIGKQIHVQVREIPMSGSSQEANIVAESSQTVGALQNSLTYRFQFRPTRTGLVFFEVLASEKGLETRHETEATSTAEATMVNNRRTVAVHRPSEIYRVLYVSGRPNWEYKFLRRSLKEDEQVNMTGLIRIAKREPKFEFRGRSGERSNPLFRGFGGVENETQRYDQPVLVRLDTKDQNELAGGFPKTAEELFGYHAVVIDDLEADFFTQEQMNLLLRFVSERGGGLLMLGGQESFREGQYGKSLLASLLPVYIDEGGRADAPDSAHPSEPQYQWEFSREGWLQPWVRLRDVESAERERVQAMPAFRVYNRIKGLKPGASMMAGVKVGGTDYPALVVQSYGHGRTAALMIGDLWRWGMQNEGSHKDMGKAWRQLVRWVVADSLKRVEVQAAMKPGDRGQAAEISVKVRKPDFDPMEDAQVAVDVKELATNGKNEDVPVNMDLAGDEAGLFRGSHWSSRPGIFRALARVSDTGGNLLGTSEAGWVSEPAADEFSSIRINRSLAEEIAGATGGKVLQVQDLDSFAATMANRSVTIQETSSEPLWHKSIWLLLALTFFAVEWTLRRRGGMA